ncbi:MAG: tetratricopeptide repeat protein [Polyangiales bacterium]
MRRGAAATMCLGAVLLTAYGCARKPESGTTQEPTTGGESLNGAAAGSEREGATPSADAPSPWGATRAEQCRQQPRPALSAKAEKTLDEGARAAAKGDTATAEASFQQTLKRDPNAYEALYDLGVLADRQGNERVAMDYYRRALGVLPDYEPAARGISTILLRRGKVQEALAVVEPLADASRANLEMQALYAELLVEARRLEEAWLAARRALKCDERFVPALIALVKASQAQGRDELADSILDQALQVDPDVAELHFLNGERAKAEPGQQREALAAYERAVQLRPDYAEARMALGIQLLASGNYATALSHFQAAAQLVPTLPAVHVDLGDAYRATRQWTEAEREYRRALELQPKLPEAHYGLALLFLTSAGEIPGVDELAAYEKAVDELKTYRAQMGPRLAKGDQSEEYLRDLDRLIERARRRVEREGGT